MRKWLHNHRPLYRVTMQIYWRSGRQCPLGQMAGESINRNKRKTRGIPLFSEQAIQTLICLSSILRSWLRLCKRPGINWSSLPISRPEGRDRIGVERHGGGSTYAEAVMIIIGHLNLSRISNSTRCCCTLFSPRSINLGKALLANWAPVERARIVRAVNNLEQDGIACNKTV
jgi:hypothetical protein